MRAMAPGTGSFGQPHRGPDVAALERLEWLRYEEAPASRAPQWLAVALVAVLVAGAVAGLITGGGDLVPAEAKLDAAYRAQQTGDLATAADLYTDVVAADPSNAVAQFNLGVLSHEQGALGDAAAQYEAALAADPTYVPALFNLAVLRAATDPTAAIDLYRRVLAVAPDHAGASMNLGLLLLERGESTEASALIDRALTLDPSLQLD
jgi:tetratricopeptide (TPR) repeat protein